MTEEKQFPNLSFGVPSETSDDSLFDASTSHQDSALFAEPQNFDFNLEVKYASEDPPSTNESESK